MPPDRKEVLMGIATVISRRIVTLFRCGHPPFRSCVPVWLALFFLPCVAVSALQPAVDSDPAIVLRNAGEAQLAFSQKLHSGEGTGIFESFHRQVGQQEFKVAVKARAHVRFDGDKYYI